MTDFPQPRDDAGADGEVDDRGEEVDAPRYKVFEMDQNDVIWTKGLGGLDGGGHLEACDLHFLALELEDCTAANLRGGGRMQCELLVEQFHTLLCIPDRLAVEAHGLIVRCLWLSTDLFDGALQFSSALPQVGLFQEFSLFGGLVGVYRLGDLPV